MCDVNAFEGLVEKEETRARQKGGGQRQLLAHPVREIGDERAAGGLEVHHLQQIVGAAACGVAIERVDLSYERQRFFGR